MGKQKTVLVCILDWGLGHATRCIPIIQYLIEKQVRVVIGSSGDALQLLKNEFPDLLFHELPPYNIWYGKGPSQIGPVLWQSIKINRVIREERKIIYSLVDRYNIDKIISDNRYGCHSDKVYSVALTHQTGLLVPGRLNVAEPLVHRWIKNHIAHFNECWIPDIETGETLSGKLSHHYPTPVKTEFIGPLTRFHFDKKPSLQYDVLAILSGPEPQRSMLEEKLLSQFKLFPDKKFILVAGKVGEQKKYNINENIEYLSSANSTKLNELVSVSEIIISRSGYSTIMDLHRSNKKVFFIPTPGQTEQEYLTKYLSEKNLCIAQPQQNLNLHEAFIELDKAGNFYFDIKAGYKNAVDNFLE